RRTLAISITPQAATADGDRARVALPTSRARSTSRRDTTHRGSNFGLSHNRRPALVRTRRWQEFRSLSAHRHRADDPEPPDPRHRLSFSRGRSRMDRSAKRPDVRTPLSDHVDVAATWPDRPAVKSSARIKMYHAKSGRQWSLAFIALALSAFGLIPLKQISDWLSGGPIPGGSAFFGAAVTLFFLAATILFISNALRGLPRLTVTPDGIKFESGIWTKCATWDAIGPFAVKVHSTSAKVAGAAPRRSRRRARTFTIPNQFTVPIGVIATDLNVARALATGETPRALKELQAKELQAKELQAKETSLGLAQFKVPWLTLSILFVLIAIFTLENML